MNFKLLETVADISYAAGLNKYYSGDSRMDMSTFIKWAQEFQELHKNTDWTTCNYMLVIESYAEAKLRN